MTSTDLGRSGGNLDHLSRPTADAHTIMVNRVSWGETRTEGEVMIIPIFEEVVVVEKRLVLKEELHISQQKKGWPAPIRWPGSNLMHGRLHGPV